MNYNWRVEWSQPWRNNRDTMRLFILCLISLTCFAGCKSKTYEIHSNELLGLQLEVPSDWDVEEPERVLVLVINPSRGKDKDSVSITVLQNLNIDGDLHDVLEAELNRLQTRLSMDEIAIIEPVEESTLNGFDVAKITIEVPIQSQIEEGMNNYTSFQPMDIFALAVGDRYIEISFRKSTINSDLNDEGQNIVNSIRAYP